MPIYRSFLILIISALLFFTACSMEAKLAENSTNKLQKANIMVVFPDQLLLKNSKSYNISKQVVGDELLKVQLDSSFFLKNCNDSICLKSFSAQIVGLLSEFGFVVYNPFTWNEFLSSKNQAFIIEFTQLELEELWKLHHDEEIMPDGYQYSQDVLLNALAFNAWISISDLTDSLNSRSFIFSESIMMDDFEGLFLMNELSGEVYYDFNQKALKPQDATKIIDDASIKFTLDILDFLINEPLEKEMLRLTGKYPERFWRFVPNRKKPSPANQKSGYIILN